MLGPRTWRQTAVATLAAWVWLLAPATPRPLWQLAAVAARLGAGGPVDRLKARERDIVRLMRNAIDRHFSKS